MMIDRAPKRPSATPGARATARPLVAAFAAALLTACGNLTAGGVGEVTVVLSGDAPDAALLAAGSTGAAPAPTPSAPLLTDHDDDTPRGEVEAEFMLFLASESGSVLQLDGDRIRLRVDVRGRNELDAVDAQPVPPARYTELQVLFTEIEAEIDAGLVIDSIPVTGQIDVELEDLTLLVARPIDLLVEGGTSAELVVDLNAPAWLQFVDPVTHIVNEAAFASLIAVSVR